MANVNVLPLPGDAALLQRGQNANCCVQARVGIGVCGEIVDRVGRRKVVIFQQRFGEADFGLNGRGKTSSIFPGALLSVAAD